MNMLSLKTHFTHLCFIHCIKYQTKHIWQMRERSRIKTCKCDAIIFLNWRDRKRSKLETQQKHHYMWYLNMVQCTRTETQAPNNGPHVFEQQARYMSSTLPQGNQERRNYNFKKGVYRSKHSQSVPSMAPVCSLYVCSEHHDRPNYAESVVLRIRSIPTFTGCNKQSNIQ